MALDESPRSSPQSAASSEPLGNQTTRRSAGDASCEEARDRSEIARLAPTSGGLTMSDIATITGEPVRAITPEEPA